MAMEQIVEALKKILPEDQVSEVSAAVEGMLNEAKGQLDSEYNDKLEEAYTELSNELAAAEKTAEAGYQEAYAIIGELRNRLEVQGEEYKTALEEGYEEAYQMLRGERDKNSTLEVDMYEEYDKKLSEMKSYIVDKVDQFLQFKGQEIYEQAKRDILNDPRMAEHKVALDKIVDITANYLSEEDFALATGTKLDEAVKAAEELKGQVRIMEARNIRLSTDNTKLNEAVRQAQEVITEHKTLLTGDRKAKTLNEQKERAGKSKNVTGRGQVATDDGVVIAEHNNGNGGEFNDILKLAGVVDDD
jgi:hypothetical protein